MMSRRLIPVLMVLLLVMSGCSLTKKWFSKEQPAPAVTPPAPAPVVPDVRAEELWPASDVRVTYSVVDQGKPEAKVQEDWVREGARVAAAISGQVYVVWELRPDGVWRVDPKGGGVWLRYLPPVLKDGEAWKQESAGRTVFFKLNKAAGECGQAAECWKVQVLNAGELTAFWFGSGSVPVRAQADNYLRPADSFVKSLVSQQAGSPAATVRKTIADKAAVTAAKESPAFTSTAEEFKLAVDQAAKKN